MKSILALVLVLTTTSIHVLLAQKENKNAFFDQYNAKRITFGGGFGGSIINSSLNRNPSGVYDLPIFNYSDDPGINAYAIANIKLTELFDIRFSPGLTFFNKQIEHTAYYGYGNNTKTYNKLNLGAGLVEFPLDLVFKLPAKNNRRIIFGAGGRYMYDLAWENNPIELERIIYKNATDFQYEAFVGIQLFSRKIVATPEFKISRGVGKVLTYQNKAVLSDTYFIAVPTNFTISLTISGN